MRLADGLGHALGDAVADLAPSTARAGTASCAVNVNRRERGPDGRIKGLPWLGVNPGGPVDREVFGLRFQRDGADDVVVAVYACHPAVLGPATVVSPDLFGAARRTAAEALGTPHVALLNGASGDLNPVVHPGGLADCRRLGVALGEAIVAAIAAAVPLEPEPLAVAAREVSLALKDEFPSPGDEMEAAWMDAVRAKIAGRTALPALVVCLRYADAALVGVPVELFCELGMDIKRRSPFARTAVVGLCRDLLGYAPTRPAYDEGGYEPDTALIAPGQSERLAEAACELLTTAGGRSAGRP